MSSNQVLCVTTNPSSQAGQGLLRVSQSLVCGPAVLALPGNLLAMQKLRPHPDLVNQNLHFNKIFRWFICMVKFEKRCPNKSIFTFICILIYLFEYKKKRITGTDQELQLRMPTAVCNVQFINKNGWTALYRHFYLTMFKVNVNNYWISV